MRNYRTLHMQEYECKYMYSDFTPEVLLLADNLIPIVACLMVYKSCTN